MANDGGPRGSRPLVITDPTLLVRLANQRLVLLRERKQVAAIPIADISHVALHGPITLTGAATASLLDAGIDVVLHSSSGRFRGVLHGARPKNVYLLLAQVDAWNRDERRLAFAATLIASKLRGQRLLLQRRALDRASAPCALAVQRIDALLRDVPTASQLETLLGFEGAASAAYFGVFGELVRAEFTFLRRVRRPPTDPVNALLSFGYTLATGELVRQLGWTGLDPRIGLLHGLRYGRESLALDLVEDFRAPMVDRFTLALLNRGQLALADFETADDGATRLHPEARRRYLELWETMLSSRAPRLDAHDSCADDEPLQHRRVSRDADEGMTEPVTWRRRMERQVDRLRRFLLNGTPYRALFSDTAARKRSKTGSHEPGGSI